MLTNLSQFFQELLANNLTLSFHGFNYILSANLTLASLLILAFLFFAPKIKRLAQWFYYILPTTCFLILGISLFFFFLPITKLYAVVFTGIFGLIAISLFVTQKGWFFKFKDFLTKERLRRLAQTFLVFNFFAILYNFSIYMTPLPYNVGVNVDFGAHAEFSKRFYTQSFYQQIQPHFENVRLNFYPIGSHAAMAYLDLVLPYAFVTTTEYAFIFMAILAIGIFGYARSKNANLWEILPLLFMPAFLMLVMFDHVNSAVAMIPTFVIFVFLVDKIAQNLLKIKPREWLQLALICLSFFFIYEFSLALIIAVGGIATAAIALFSSDVKKLLWKYKWQVLTVLLLSIIAGVSIVVFWWSFIKLVISLSINQGQIDNFGINPLQFLGIFNYSYSYLREGLELWPLQILTVVFWLTVLGGRTLNKKEWVSKRGLYIVAGVMLLFFFGVLEIIFHSDYIRVRYYSYLILFIIVFLINTQSVWQTKKIYKTGLIALAILVSFGLIKMQLENQIDRRAAATRDVKITYKDAIEIENILLPGARIAMANKFGFSRILQMFLFPGYGNSMRFFYWPESVSKVPLDEYDYVITIYEQIENYPMEMLELVKSDREMDYAVFKVLTKKHNTLPSKLNVAEEQYYTLTEMKSGLEMEAQRYLTLGLDVDWNNQFCTYAGYGQDLIKELDQLEINQPDASSKLKINYLFVYPEVQSDIADTATGAGQLRCMSKQATMLCE